MMIEEKMQAAPDEDSLVIVDRTLVKSPDIEFFGGRADLGQNKMAELRIMNMQSDSILMYTNGHKYVDKSLYYPELVDNGPQRLEITKNEAVLIGNETVKKLGADHMQLAGYGTGIIDVEGGAFPNSFDPNTTQAHLLYYTRHLQGNTDHI